MATKKTAAQLAKEKKDKEAANKRKKDSESAQKKAETAARDAAREKLLNDGITNPDPAQLEAETKNQMGDALKSGEELAAKYINPEAFKHISEDRTDEETSTLSMLKAEQEKSGNRTPEAALALGKFQEALGGFDSQEGQALKETARRQLDTQYQTQMAQAKASQARSGVRGGAGAAQSAIMQRDRARAQTGLETDLAVQNIGVKNQALQNFGGYVSNLDASEAARRQSATGMYAGQVNAQTERDLGKTQFNIGQDQSMAQANLQAVLGGANIYSSTYGSNLGNSLAFQSMQKTLALQQEQLKQSDEANRAYQQSLKSYSDNAASNGGNSGGGGSGGGTSTPRKVTPVKKATTPIKKTTTPVRR